MRAAPLVFDARAASPESGRPEHCFAGRGGHERPAKEGGGVPEMGFRAGPFVLCKDGCCYQRRRNTNFGPENFFSLKNFPPHMCSQNDQRDVGIILSHVCWGWTPPPCTAGRAAPAQTPLPARRPRRGRGRLGKWASVPPPPPQSNFLPALPVFFFLAQSTALHAPQAQGSGVVSDVGGAASTMHLFYSGNLPDTIVLLCCCPVRCRVAEPVPHFTLHDPP